MQIAVSVRSERRFTLQISPQGENPCVFMAPYRIDDEGVVLLQALLSQGLTRSLRDGGQRAAISITRCLAAPVLTPVEFRSLVGPLMPFILPSPGSVRTVVPGASLLFGDI
jgi:hypothetical protein